MQDPPGARGHVVALLTDRATAAATIEQAADVAGDQGLDLVLVPSMENVGDSRPTGPWLAQRIEDLRRGGSGVAASVAPRESQRGARALREATVVVVPPQGLADALHARLSRILVADCRRGPLLHQRVVAAALTGGSADTAVVAAASQEARRRSCELRLVHPCEREEGRWPTSRDSWLVRTACRHTDSPAPSGEGLSVSTFSGAGDFDHVVSRYCRGVELVVLASTGDPETDLQRVRLVAHGASNVLLLQDTAPAVLSPRAEPVAVPTVRALVGRQ